MSTQLLQRFADHHELLSHRNQKVDPEQASTWSPDTIAKVGVALNCWQDEPKKRLKVFLGKQLTTRPSEVNWLDPATAVGQANLKTQAAFKAHGLDFNQWFGYPKKEVFSAAGQQEADPDKLLESSLKELNEHFPRLVQELDASQKADLERNLKTAGLVAHPQTRQLKLVSEEKQGATDWLAAIKALNDWLTKTNLWDQVLAKKSDSRERLSEIQYHLQSVEDQLGCVDEVAANTQRKSFTMGLWKREPGSDLTIGDKVRCCIALDNDNAKALIDYLQSGMMQFIEVKEPKSGKTASISLLYWVLDHQKKPALVVDIIQANKDFPASDRERIRDKTLNYATELAQAVAGKATPVWLGGQYHTVDVTGTKTKRSFTLLGEYTHQDVFLNAASGWKKAKETHQAEFYTVA